MLNFITGGVCAAQGFRAGGIHVGVKTHAAWKKDVALIVSDEACACAAVYTKNAVKAAHIHVDKRHLADGKARAAVINSGNANACTGEAGKQANADMAAALAKELGVDLYYLSHFFREHFGLSFQEYLAKLRCEKARRELLLTDRSLLDISLSCGFSSPKYFQRAFQKQYGATPKEYRRQAPRETGELPAASVLTSQEFLSDHESLRVVQRLLEQG